MVVLHNMKNIIMSPFRLHILSRWVLGNTIVCVVVSYVIADAGVRALHCMVVLATDLDVCLARGTPDSSVRVTLC
jgi:hypothetical protein